MERILRELAKWLPPIILAQEPSNLNNFRRQLNRLNHLVKHSKICSKNKKAFIAIMNTFLILLASQSLASLHIVTQIEIMISQISTLIKLLQNNRITINNLINLNQNIENTLRIVLQTQGAPGAPGPPGPPGPGCVEPLPIVTQIVNVNKGGNDASANGSECNPFLTVTAAMAFITDASPTKRYAIQIGPGTYTEPIIHLKANVQLIGTGHLLTRLAIPFDINDPTWNGGLNVDNRSGFADLSLLSGPLDFNFTTNLVTPSTGRLFFVSVNISPTPVFTGNSTFLSQVNIRDSQLFGGYTQNGANVSMFASYVGGVPLPLTQPVITINSIVPYDTQVHLVGGGTDGDVVVNVTAGTVPIDPFDLLSFAIKGSLIVNGVNSVITRIRATVDSIPVRSRVSLMGNTTIEYLDDAAGLGYTPANPADWDDPDPTTVQQALDRIAAFIGPIPI